MKTDIDHLQNPRTDQELRALILGKRGVDPVAEQAFFHPDYERDLHDPFLFRDMAKVVERVRLAQSTGETIGVFGDFDADGVTSAVTLCETLEMLGVPSLPYHPHKVDEGHGLNLKALEFFADQGIKLVFTLDCGVMNHLEIAAAHVMGLEVIVIDHHHVPEELPAAFAIINPKDTRDSYPFPELCGAGTTFKLAQALISTLAPTQVPQLKWLLDIVALGTVADVMPLVGENRTLVHYGLLVLARTRRPGITHLVEVGRLARGGDMVWTARTIAFQLAPRINAASRMAHADTAHAFLRSRDDAESLILAQTLDGYNVERRKITETVVKLAMADAAERFSTEPFVFSISPDYPLGIVGLVAGKMADELGKPVGIFTQGETESTGSFRSIPAVHIAEVLEECSDLLVRHGGHAAAGGCTVLNANIAELEKRFGAAVRKRLGNAPPEKPLEAECVLPLELCNTLTTKLVDSLQPCGEGNRLPQFVVCGTIDSAKQIGKSGEHWKLKIVQSSKFKAESVDTKPIDAVGWSMVKHYPDLRPGQSIDLLVELVHSDWSGQTELRIVEIL